MVGFSDSKSMLLHISNEVNTDDPFTLVDFRLSYLSAIYNAIIIMLL